MKIILVILDGLGDRSYGVLNHRTPLQSAETPNMDRLSRLGGNGLFHASFPGQCLPSETAHYLLLGYDMGTFPGRGLLEAAGAGLSFHDHDVLSLAHLTSISKNNGYAVLTGGRKSIRGGSDQISSLYESISSYETHGIRFSLQRTGFNDAILIMSGEVAPYVSDSDPMIVERAMALVKPLKGNAEPEASRRTAEALNEYLTHCHGVLSSHPANRILSEKGLPSANFLATQRAGRRIPQQSFHATWGLKGMMIASGPIYSGLALELGMTSVSAEDTENPGIDLGVRLDVALRDNAHDFFLVHTKAPDEAAHRGDPVEKTKIISSLDRGLEGLSKATKEGAGLIVAIASDHSTPCGSQLIHSGEPVPVLIAGANTRRDDVASYDEVSAASGCLGLLRGRELMLTLLNCAGRSSLLGHRLGEIQRDYFPGDYEKFRL